MGLSNHRMGVIRTRREELELGVRALLERSESLTDIHFQKVAASLRSLLDDVELLGVDMLTRLPDSFSEIRLLQNDLRALVELGSEFSACLSQIAVTRGFRYPKPAGHDYENAILVAALALDPSDRMKFRETLVSHEFPTWDEDAVAQHIGRAEAGSTFIPRDVVLDDPAFDQLVDQFISRERPTALLLGAGGSIAVTRPGLPDGTPTWPAFIEYMIRLTGKNAGWTQEKVDSVLADSETNGIRELQRCKEALGTYWLEVLEDLFGWHIVEGKIRNTSLYRNLHRLPFACRLTANYDALYERINNVTSVSAANLHKAVLKWSNRKWSTTIAHFHGFIDVADDLVVTEADYNERYGSVEWNTLLRDVFRSYNVLFVGFGLSDPFFLFALNRIWREVRKAAPEERHYYIFTDEQDEWKRSNFQKQYGFELIRYPAGIHEYQSYYIQELVDRFHRHMNSQKLAPPA